MIQFLILFTLVTPHGKPHKIWHYGTPSYYMISEDDSENECQEAAKKVVKQVFARAKAKHFKKWKARITCHPLDGTGESA